MVTAAWLALTGYLLVALGELIPTQFRTGAKGLRVEMAVCFAALAYALGWPLRWCLRDRQDG